MATEPRALDILEAAPMRAAWALAGLFVLALSAAGVYVSFRSTAAPPARPQGDFVMRIHETPRALAELAFEDGAGRGRSLSQWQGKVVLLNVWATWCAPCREEMPALDRLQRKLGGRDFEVLALSIDSQGAGPVKRFYEELGIRSLAVYVDPSMRATATLGAVGVPTTLLIDRQGREIGRRTGPAEWDGPQAVRMFEEYVSRDRKP